MIAILTFIVGLYFGFFICSSLVISKDTDTNAENKKLEDD